MPIGRLILSVEDNDGRMVAARRYVNIFKWFNILFERKNGVSEEIFKDTFGDTTPEQYDILYDNCVTVMYRPESYGVGYLCGMFGIVWEDKGYVLSTDICVYGTDFNNLLGEIGDTHSSIILDTPEKLFMELTDFMMDYTEGFYE